MTLFWILAAAMTLAAVVAVAPALLRNRRESALNRDRQNVAIARERMAELEREHEAGALSTETLDQVKSELEQALADDLADASTEQAARSGGRWALGILLIVFPAMAFGLYWHLGAPEHLEVKGASAGRAPAGPHAAGDGKMPSVDELVVSLEEKLAEDPSRAEGWYLLGRTYMSMQRYEDAVKAYKKLIELAPDQPTLLVALADAEAMVQGARISGRPAELVQRALVLDPDNTTALWLAGKAEVEAGNYSEAVAYWRRVEAQSADNPQTLAEIRNQIAAAERQGGLASNAPVAGESQTETASSAATASPGIEVSVSLAGDLAVKAAPDDTVFVYARAIEGPPMPLAVARHTVGDLPVTVRLTDDMAMIPQMKLSNFPQVRVSARVSRTGDAKTQPGDLVSEDAQVDVANAKKLNLVIDREVQ
mgnify:FL=1